MSDRRDELDDEAAEWIGRLRRPRLTAAERRAFAHWLAASPAHRAAFDDMQRIWERVGVLRHAPGLPGPQSRWLAAVSWARGRWQGRWHGRWPAGWHGGWRVPVLAGVAATVLATLAWLQQPPLEIDVRTAIGETRTVHLADQSTIEVNVATALRYRVDSGERLIEVSAGEAFFRVAADARRPFRVRTHDGLVTATGTAFGVLQRDDGTRVALTQGTVEVTPARRGAAVVVLHAPALLLLTEATGQRLNGVAEDAVAWRQGQLVYDQVTLAELLADLNRYMPVHVRLTDARLAERRVSAVLRIEEQEATLNALARILDLHWKQVGPDTILLGPSV